MERVLKEDDFIVSNTDLKGKIIYCNQIFMDMAEFSEEELLGKPHNIIRHEDMPKVVFKYLWEEIKAKREVFAFVINKTKNGNFYWVFANVTATLDEKGNIVSYYSVRRKPNPEAIKVIHPLYLEMIQAEKKGGVDASFKILSELLESKGVSYAELIISLQG